MKRQIITLTGIDIPSYKNIYDLKYLQFSLQGFIVFTPIHNIQKNKLTDLDLELLKKIKYEKIEMSNILYVVNPENYLSDETKEEIQYAISLNKEVIFYFNDKIPHSKQYRKMQISSDTILSVEDYNEWFNYINSLLNKYILNSNLNKYEKLEFSIKSILNEKIIELNICKDIGKAQFESKNFIETVKDFLILIHSHIVLNSEFQSFNISTICFIEDFLFEKIN
jgi:hypothetical protein